MGARGVYGWMHGAEHHRGGVGFFRIAEPLRVFDQLAPTFHGTDITYDVLDQCDTIVVHNPTDIDRSLTWSDLARAQTHRLILDVDDAMWCPDFQGFRDYYRPEVLERLYANVRLAHVVTTPSAVIADHLSQYNPNVWVVPNTVPAWLLDHRPIRPVRPTVGFQGSDSHVHDWRRQEQQRLGRFLQEHPDWDLHTYGGFGSHLFGKSPRVHYTPWASSTEDYWRNVSLTVGVGPLRDTPFNRAKSALRAVEYMALGIVPVLPHLRPYWGVYTDGVEGKFIHPHQTMYTVLRGLARDGLGVIAEMAERGRQLARLYTTEANLERIAAAWMSV